MGELIVFSTHSFVFTLASTNGMADLKNHSGEGNDVAAEVSLHASDRRNGGNINKPIEQRKNSSQMSVHFFYSSTESRTVSVMA